MDTPHKLETLMYH